MVGQAAQYIRACIRDMYCSGLSAIIYTHRPQIPRHVTVHIALSIAVVYVLLSPPLIHSDSVGIQVKVGSTAYSYVPDCSD